jgi:Calcineurin-like phosphoesterase
MAAPTRVKVFATSDLHTDEDGNARLVEDEWCNSGGSAAGEAGNGAVNVLIVAGDISKRLSTIRRTLTALKECGKWQEVCFVAGNSELRLEDRGSKKSRSKHTHHGGEGGASAGNPRDSLAKLEQVYALCEELGVRTKPVVIGDVLVCPIVGWYTPFFDSAHVPGDTSHHRRWLDFRTVVWPTHGEMMERCRELASENRSEPGGLDSDMKEVSDEVNSDDSDDLALEVDDNDALPSRVLRLWNWKNVDDARRMAEECESVVTFSHFLPRFELMPPFLNKARKLSLVVGDPAIDEQLRALGSSVHVFGHTHWQADTTIEGVRYIQNPIGHSRERTGVIHKRVSEPMLAFDSAGRRGWTEWLGSLWKS